MSEYEAPYPHCDEMVLHAPGKCWACDLYPAKQEARRIMGVNFTEQNDPDKASCPAEQRRPVGKINRWGGNVAQPTKPKGI